jgi:EAL domain-containing protein (putative c-di-GMP-specific phosphodiesterase class I)
MSNSLDLEVTAEGVETIEQLQLLCAKGCHELQGFLLGPPMPEEEVDHFALSNVVRQSIEARLGAAPPAVGEASALIYI